MLIFKLNEYEGRSVGKFFTELLAQAGTAVLKNQRKDQVATRIPISGTVDKAETAIWPTVFGVLRNAYIEAFKGEIDNDITLNDAFKTFKEDYKAKRTEKKAERKAERAEKKETRQEKREERKKEWQQKRAERNREK